MYSKRCRGYTKLSNLCLRGPWYVTNQDLVSVHHVSSQFAESNSSNHPEPDVYLTQQRVCGSDYFEAHPQTLENYASADRCTAGSQALMVSPVHEPQISSENNPNNPSESDLSPTQQGAWVLGAVEALAEPIQISASEDKGILRSQDMLVQPVHENQLSMGSYPNNSSESDISSTQREACAPYAFDDFAQDLQICPTRDHATSGTQDLQVLPAREHHTTVDYNLNKPSLPDVSKTQWEEYVSRISVTLGQVLSINASEDQAIPETETDVVSAHSESLPPVESNPNNPLVQDYSSVQQNECLPDTCETLAQALQIYMFHNQGTPRTPYFQISAHHEFGESDANNPSEPGVSSAQKSLCVSDAYDAFARVLQNSASEDQESGNQNLVESPVHEIQLSAESNTLNPLIPAYSLAQWGKYVPGTSESPAQALQVYASIDECTQWIKNVVVSDHESSLPGENNSNNPLEPDLSSTQQGLCVPDACEALAYEGQAILSTQVLLASTHHECPSPTEFNPNDVSEPYASPTQQGDGDQEVFEALAHVLQIHTFNDQGTSEVQDLLTSARHKSLVLAESYTSEPGVSQKQQRESIPDAYEGIAQTPQMYVSENQGLSGSQDILFLANHEFPLPAGSNPNNPPDMRISLTQQGGHVQNSLETLAQAFQICAFNNQGTSRTQVSLLSAHQEYLVPAGSYPSESDVSQKQQRESIPEAYEGFAQVIQIYASKEQCTSETQALMVSTRHDCAAPTEISPNNVSEPHASPMQQGDCDQVVFEAPAHVLQIHTFNDQSTSGTPDLLASPRYKSVDPAESYPSERDVSLKQQRESIPEAYEGLAQTPQICVSENQGLSGSQDILVLAHHEFPLPAESNPNNAPDMGLSQTQQGDHDQDSLETLAQALQICAFNNHGSSRTQVSLLSVHHESVAPAESYPSEPDVTQKQPDESIPEAYEGFAEVIQICASKEKGTAKTQDLLVSFFQECSLSEESNTRSPSVQEETPVQQGECIPGGFEDRAEWLQIYASKDQGMSEMPEEVKKGRTSDADGSSARNCVEETVVLTSSVGVMKYKENQDAHQQEEPTFKGKSRVGSKISNSRSYNMSDNSKSSSNSNYSATKSPHMFSSFLSLSDTDDETDRAEFFETMMSLVGLYSDYFEDLEENQGEEYIINKISADVDTASTMIGELRMIAARIFTSPKAAGNAIYDINWTVLHLSVDEEVDLHDVGSWYKLRLLGVKAYIRTTCVGTSVEGTAETIRQERLCNEQKGSTVRPSFAGDQSGSVIQIASRPWETDVRGEGAIPFSNGVHRDSGTTAAERRYGRANSSGVKEGDQVYTVSPRCPQVDDRTRPRAAVKKIYSIAEERVCRIRVMNWVMLACFKTVLNVLGLGLEAKRMAQRAVKEAMRRQLPGTNYEVATVAELAIAATNCAETALTQMEEAVELHKVAVDALRRAERSLYNLRTEVSCGRNDIRDIIACVDIIEEAVQSTCEINLDKVSRDVPVGAPGAGRLPTPMTIDQGSDQGPRDVFQALFWASQSAVKTIDVTLHGLQNLSLSMLRVLVSGDYEAPLAVHRNCSTS